MIKPLFLGVAVFFFYLPWGTKGKGIFKSEESWIERIILVNRNDRYLYHVINRYQTIILIFLQIKSIIYKNECSLNFCEIKE